MKKQVKNVQKRLLVLVILLLVTLQNSMAQCVTQSQKEKTDSESVAQNGQTTKTYDDSDIEKIIEIAEEEIERTSQEAVKAALEDVGGELAYEKERADQYEALNIELKKENEKLKEENSNKFLWGAVAGGAGGVIITSLIFSLVNSFVR